MSSLNKSMDFEKLPEELKKEMVRLYEAYDNEELLNKLRSLSESTTKSPEKTLIQKTSKSTTFKDSKSPQKNYNPVSDTSKEHGSLIYDCAKMNSKLYPVVLLEKLDMSRINCKTSSSNKTVIEKVTSTNLRKVGSKTMMSENKLKKSKKCETKQEMASKFISTTDSKLSPNRILNTTSGEMRESPKKVSEPQTDSTNDVKNPHLKVKSVSPLKVKKTLDVKVTKSEASKPDPQNVTKLIRKASQKEVVVTDLETDVKKDLDDTKNINSSVNKRSFKRKLFPKEHVTSNTKKQTLNKNNHKVTDDHPSILKSSVAKSSKASQISTESSVIDRIPTTRSLRRRINSEAISNLKPKITSDIKKQPFNTIGVNKDCLDSTTTLSDHKASKAAGDVVNSTGSIAVAITSLLKKRKDHISSKSETVSSPKLESPKTKMSGPIDVEGEMSLKTTTNTPSPLRKKRKGTTTGEIECLENSVVIKKNTGVVANLTKSIAMTSPLKKRNKIFSENETVSNLEQESLKSKASCLIGVGKDDNKKEVSIRSPDTTSRLRKKIKALTADDQMERHGNSVEMQHNADAYSRLSKICSSHGLSLDEIFHREEIKEMIEKNKNNSEAIVFIGTHKCDSTGKIEPIVHIHKSKKVLLETLAANGASLKINR